MLQVQTERPESPEQAEAQARLDYRWALGDQRGRRILRAMLRWSGVEDTGPVAGIEQMAFAAGARMVGNMLRAQLRKHAPEGWVQLEAEYVQELVHQARQEQQQTLRGRDQ